MQDLVRSFDEHSTGDAIARGAIGAARRPAATNQARLPDRAADATADKDRRGGIGRQGLPVTFCGTVGLFYPGAAPVAVLMLSPVGYEEMCCRTTWRSLAEAIAAAGLPCLRFDHPGTGDALDPADPPDGIEDWRRAAIEAGALLRRLTGVDRIVLLGQGLGAALAATVAAEIGTVDAIAYLAPVTDGRRHLRELGMWGRMITDRIGIEPDPDEVSGYAVAGFGLPPGRVAAIRALDLTQPGAAPLVPSLVVSRPGRSSDAAFAAALAGRGPPVAEIPYDGYEKLAADPSVAVPPSGTIAAVVAWLTTRVAEQDGPAPPRSQTPTSRAPLAGDGFVEEPVRFGPGRCLFGVLCRPAAPGRGTAVVFVGSGRDYHVGLGRATVLQARLFAAEGIASLRFDPGGIGDSPVGSPDVGEVLYSKGQIDDVVAAVDVMASSGFPAVTLLGRCSGAHAAFHAAIRDDRVRRLVMLNLSRFVWDPAEDVSESLRYGHRRLGDFGSVLWSADGVRRLLTGRLRVGAAGRHLVRRWITGAGLRLAPLLGDLTRQGRAWRAVRHGMAALAKRHVPVALVYSVGDPGLDELRRYFGRSGRGLDGFAGASMELIADADHNFTHRGAHARLTATLSRALTS